MAQRNTAICSCAIVASFLGASSAQASEDASAGMLSTVVETLADGLDLLIPDDVRDTRVRLGAGFGLTPDYVGSDDHRFRAIPLVDIRYKNRWRFVHKRLNYDAIITGNWRLGPFAKLKGGRRERRNPALEGLGDIGRTVELGAFARYRTDRALFNVEYRHALGASQGDSVRVTAGHAIFKAGDFAAALVGSAKWMSDQGMQTYYGVTEAQAERSVAALPAFTADSGVSQVTASLYVRYKVSDRVRLLGLVNYGRLLGDAANSPLVADGVGSRHQVTAGAGFTIDF